MLSVLSAESSDLLGFSLKLAKSRCFFASVRQSDERYHKKKEILIWELHCGIVSFYVFCGWNNHILSGKGG